jgi:hypothetical protein
MSLGIPEIKVVWSLQSLLQPGQPIGHSLRLKQADGLNGAVYVVGVG